MGKKDDSGSVGNTDPDKRGRKLPPQRRDGTGGKDPDKRGGVGYGDVTEDPKKD